ncbi:hypothetical protein, partial [Ekhidna sp.]
VVFLSTITIPLLEHLRRVPEHNHYPLAHYTRPFFNTSRSVHDNVRLRWVEIPQHYDQLIWNAESQIFKNQKSNSQFPKYYPNLPSRKTFNTDRTRPQALPSLSSALPETSPSSLKEINANHGKYHSNSHAHQKINLKPRKFMLETARNPITPDKSLPLFSTPAIDTQIATVMRDSIRHIT